MGEAIAEIKRSSGFLILLGVLLVIFGMIAIGSPLITGVAVAVTVGVLVLVSGICQLVLAFRARSWGSGILAFALGLLTLIAGGFMLGRPVGTLKFLTLVLAGWFVVSGVFEIIYAFDLRPLRGWGWTLFSGIVALLLGLMIWRQWPLSGALALGVLVGIKILFSGWSAIFLGAAARGGTSQAAST